jgi:predicted ATP-binding protein involved in virulence
MKISTLKLKNIGVFDEAIFEFDTPNGTNIHILTGPNGSGKTTILLALAGVFMQNTRHYPEHESAIFLNKRVRFFEKIGKNELKSYAEYKFKTGIISKLIGCPSCKNFHVIKSGIEDKVQEYAKIMLSGKQIPSFLFEFAAFAYSGYRYIQSEKIDVLSNEVKINPLENSLDFVKNYVDNSASILQWIANNAAKYYIAKGRGDSNAIRFKDAINTVEFILQEITGKKTFFDISIEPTTVLLNIDGTSFDFDVLPDGLRSLISWVADLLMRLDIMNWKDNTPILERSIILFLDEIEAHLHPKWQRKVLPVVQKLFKNAQVFVSTHSPFVVNSINGAYIHKIDIVNGKAILQPVEISKTSNSIDAVLGEVFGVDEDFGLDTEAQLKEFYSMRNEIAKRNQVDEVKFFEVANKLAVSSEELNNIVQFELRQLNHITGKKFQL